MLTQNSLVALMFSRVSFGLAGDSVKLTLTRGGLCDTWMGRQHVHYSGAEELSHHPQPHLIDKLLLLALAHAKAEERRSPVAVRAVR